MKPARLSPADLIRLGAAGLRSRPLRVVLSALGIAIGIAAMVSVVGISASSRADLLAQLDRLGTNLLEVQPGSDGFGQSQKLPATAPAIIAMKVVSSRIPLPQDNSSSGRTSGSKPYFAGPKKAACVLARKITANAMPVLPFRKA